MCAHYSGEYFVISSCTDKTWNSPACPGYFYFRDHVHNSVFRCSADKYCCADGPSCNCTTGINTLEIHDLFPEYSDLVGSAVTPNTAVATSSLFTPIGAFSKRIITAPASTADSSSTTHVVTTSSSAAADALPTPSESASEGSHANSKALTIGPGVGLSLGGVAVIFFVLLCFMWRWSKQNKQLIEVSQTQWPYQTQLPPHPQAPVEAPAYPKPYTHHPRVKSAELPVYEAPGHGI
ncbi:hypothetical protein N8T08_004842 [Aspergillus melleus]|uniref:Uncharacterized protein n=1 Tax=Aspergillus melleus TaxID=138277 RepID=A0ACC3B455_9EURO|nr:hypothetical protein N8T08_004842 [Aspergillus melleus]